MQRIAERDDPVLPAFAGACLSNVMPAILEEPRIGEGWMPPEVAAADQVVLLLLDGLGWNQLADRVASAPVLASGTGGPITVVAPSTTATSLTSLTTGCAPGEHGIVGYRIHVDDEVLNVLRWSTERGDARTRVLPSSFQPVDPFGGRGPVVVTRSEFDRSGFTQAHLEGGRLHGWRTPALLVHEVDAALQAGERFVYAYYDGLDRVGHEYGHGDRYLAELAFIDRLVGDLVACLPDGAVLVVTADHGQVETGDARVQLDPGVVSASHLESGEARFVWLHARPNRRDELLQRAHEAHGETAWVRSREQILDEQWFGPVVTDAARDRLGDVALVARDRWAFVDESTRSFDLLGRHGSLTTDEMYVPLLAFTPGQNPPTV